MTTLESLREQVRQRADMENSNFVKDPELNLYINASYGELYDLLVSRQEDYFVVDSTFTLTTTNTQALPADFYKLVGIDFLIDSNQESAISLRKFNFAERNAYARENVPARTFRGIPERMYRIVGEEIFILPESNANGTYKIWYIPKMTALAADADELDANCDIWAEYIVIDAAIKCLVKEESDVTVLMMLKDQIKRRIEAMSANRDAGEPERIADVYREDEDFPFRGGGWY